MKQSKKEISQEVYERAVAHSGIITGEDYCKVYSPQEYLGYGVYSQRVFKENDKYFVQYELGDTCD